MKADSRNDHPTNMICLRMRFQLSSDLVIFARYDDPFLSHSDSQRCVSANHAFLVEPALNCGVLDSDLGGFAGPSPLSS